MRQIFLVLILSIYVAACCAEEMAAEIDLARISEAVPTANEAADLRYDFRNDPIAEAFFGKVPPLLVTVLERYRKFREYSTKQFPLDRKNYFEYRQKIIQALIGSMNGPNGKGKGWILTDHESSRSAIAKRFTSEPIKTVNIGGRSIELYLLKIKDTDDYVPIALCFPEKTPAPGVILFSGHSAEGGLRELFIDRDSYQKAMALRLCESGFATMAVEKIDSGVMTSHFQLEGRRWQREDEPGGGGDDEFEAATALLAIGDYLLPGRQLMANIASLEFFASDKRVDSGRIGAAGVSLGGWLALQTALVDKRIRAIANFGGMWSYFDLYDSKDRLTEFEGVNCFSQLVPGLWRLGDQNRFVLAAAPIKMLIGYGDRDVPYVEHKKFYYPVLQKQYAKLGASANIEVIEHQGGHEFPVAPVIEYFRKTL